MNGSSKNDLKATIALQFKMMTAAEETIVDLRAKLQAAEREIKFQRENLPVYAVEYQRELESKLQAAEERLGEALSLLILKDSMLDGRDRHALKRDNEIVSLSTQVITLTNRADAAEAERDAEILESYNQGIHDQASIRRAELAESEAEITRLQAEVVRLTRALEIIHDYEENLGAWTESYSVALRALEAGK